MWFGGDSDRGNQENHSTDFGFCKDEFLAYPLRATGHELGLGSPAGISQAGGPSFGFERTAANGSIEKLKSADARVCPQPIAATKKDASHRNRSSEEDRPPTDNRDFCEMTDTCFYTLSW